MTDKYFEKVQLIMLGVFIGMITLFMLYMNLRAGGSSFWMERVVEEVDGGYLVDFVAHERKLTQYNFGMMGIAALISYMVLKGIYTKTYCMGFAVPLGVLLAAGLSLQVWYPGFEKHMLFLVVGVVVMFVVKTLNAQPFGPWMTLFLLFGVAGCLGVQILLNLFGAATNGATGWISIGGISLQPGEFLKALLILYCANAARYETTDKVGVSMIALGGISTGVLIMASDLGNAVVVLAIFLVSSFYLYPKISAAAKKTALAAVAASGLFIVYAFKNFGHVLQRFAYVLKALEVGEDYNSPAHQIYLSLMSILKNGLRGCGVGDSVGIENVVSVFASNNDLSLNSIVGIYGIGALVVILLCYILLILLPVLTPVASPSHYMCLSLLGVVIFVQVALQLGGGMNVFPLTGIVAPLISSGGSSMLSIFILLGACYSGLSAPVSLPEPLSRFFASCKAKLERRKVYE